jgi:hypothetical protein
MVAFYFFSQGFFFFFSGATCGVRVQTLQPQPVKGLKHQPHHLQSPSPQIAVRLFNLRKQIVVQVFVHFLNMLIAPSSPHVSTVAG